MTYICETVRFAILWTSIKFARQAPRQAPRQVPRQVPRQAGGFIC